MDIDLEHDPLRGVWSGTANTDEADTQDANSDEANTQDADDSWGQWNGSDVKSSCAGWSDRK